jgi:hypothetical protein
MNKNLSFSKNIIDNESEIKRLNEIIKNLNDIINKPVLKFDNNEIFEEAIKNMFVNIKSIVFEHIIEDYYNIVDDGISNIIRIYFNDTIYSELNKITGYKYFTWCSNTSWDIVYSIEASIQGLIKTNKISCFRDDELANFIYEDIKWRIYDEFNDYSIISL